MPFRPTTLTANNGTPHLAPLVLSVPHPAGSGNGATVAVTVTLPANMPPQTDRYAIAITPSQALFAFVTTKSLSGLNITLAPLSATTTIAAGVLDVILFG